MESELVWDTL
jgi:hypothetical protein